MGREIALWMSLMTLIGFGIGIGSATLLHIWAFRFPLAVPMLNLLTLEAIDYLAIFGFVVLAIALSIGIGRGLGRRIAGPLTSLADAASRITDGEFSARAVVQGRALRETSRLVGDFNAMASRLESLADGLVAWNAAIAHELRTPVTILKGRLQGVWDGVLEMDDATQISLLRQIDQLARLVEDLRIVSLADSGRLVLQIELVDLGQIIGELREAVEPDLAGAGFTTTWTLEPAVMPCDPTRIRQAVLALIVNARVHARPGPLDVALKRRDSTVLISVEDTGPDPKQESTTVAFDPFQRPSPSHKGSGLGLAVVRAIVDAHGGRLLYRPGNHDGSLFEIELPVHPPGAFVQPAPSDTFGRYLQ